MENFVAIDFETINKEKEPCSVSLVNFVDGKPTDKFYSLIYQPAGNFDKNTIRIHGITPEAVKDAPKLCDLIPDIAKMVNGKMVVAHYAPFDIGILARILESCDTKDYLFNYACTLSLSRRTFKGLVNYRLDTLCEHLGIDLQHHNAESDAVSCGKLMLAILTEHNLDSFESLFDKVKYNKGFVDYNTYTSARMNKDSTNSHKNYRNVAASVDVNANADEDNFFFGKTVVITGTLSVPRADAMELIGEKGGKPAGDITKKTNVLIVGRADYGNFKNGNKSTKMIRAEKYIGEGQDLEIISEDDFFEYLG